MQKKCFKCHTLKPISEFYAHKETVDGYLNKCKECTKKDVRRRYHDPESREKIREYEKSRFKTPERKAKILEYQRKRRASNPEREGVYRMTRKLDKQPCEVCGLVRAQAHHDDYSKPLEVRWLCFKHHREAHGQEPF